VPPFPLATANASTIVDPIATVGPLGSVGAGVAALTGVGPQRGRDRLPVLGQRLEAVVRALPARPQVGVGTAERAPPARLVEVGDGLSVGRDVASALHGRAHRLVVPCRARHVADIGPARDDHHGVGRVVLYGVSDRVRVRDRVRVHEHDARVSVNRVRNPGGVHGGRVAAEHAGERRLAAVRNEECHGRGMRRPAENIFGAVRANFRDWAGKPITPSAKILKTAMAGPIRVRHLDTDADFAETAARRLEAADDRLAVTPETDPQAVLDALPSTDCVIAEYELAGTDGIELLGDVRDRYPDLPFILFTSEGDEQTAADAISAGATDYVRKTSDGDQYDVLANRVVNAVEQRDSATSYREIFEKAADGIFLHDPETGRVNDVNPRAAEMLGYSREELIEMEVGEFSADRPAFSQSEAEKRVRAAVEDGPQTFEWLFQSKDGDEFWIEVHLKLAVIDDREQVIAMTRDISERKEREHRLRDQTEKVRALHEVAADIEAADDPADVYDLLHDAAEEILRYDHGMVDAVEDGGLVPVAMPDDTPADAYHEYTPLDAEDSLAARAYRRGGSSIVDDLADLDVTPAEPAYRSAITAPIPDYGVFQAVTEAPGGFDETDRDLVELLVTHARETLARLERESELREYAAELERQNERLDEFAGVVSHDLRGPLNVAAGRIELARDECDSDSLDTAADALDRMSEMIDRTLALAREGETAGDTEPVSLETVAGQSWRVISTSDAALDVAADPTLQADPDRLRNLFENLFRNAIDHGGAGVTITVGELDGGFYVADDGPGIPETDREQVFKPGYSTAEDGTGFGLAIVEEIAHAHQADVTVTESETGGTRFEFTGFDGS
jgi:PAS domain S-box-containing protein